jgi:hemoglobin/transferrin/lactoferrin receptor protein
MPARAQQTTEAAAQEVAPSAQSFSISSQPLATALTQFGAQSGLQVSVDSASTTGLTSPGANGTLTPSDALGQLLAGTGLVYRFSGSGTVIISSEDVVEGATIEGAIALDTITVSGGDAGAAAVDLPYETAGSVSHISREQIDRVPPSSPGDVFINTPGVINAGNRVGTSINPNIRGMQSMGRVNTTVDGTRQTTSSYRGYIGNRDETYIDPDMIGGIDISKGPSTGVGVGGIGGSVGIRTLEAGDIVRPGDTTSTRVKASIGGNTSSPPETGTMESADRPRVFGDSFSGSIATATIRDNYEGVIAYSKRKSGNYFAGTDVPSGIDLSSTLINRAQVLAGEEVLNTSEDTESFLAKGKVRFGDGHSVQLGYLHYGSESGEISDLFLTVGTPNAQYDLTNTRVDTYTAKYRYQPADNPYVNARANLWFTDLFSDRFLGTVEYPYGTRTFGGDIGNTAIVTTDIGELTLDGGLEFVREHAFSEQFPSTISNSNGWETYGPSAVRLMTSAYTSASLKATDWLTLSGGARYDHYNSEGEGYLADFADSSGDRVSPNASITLTPMEGVQLYGLYSEGYRPPSLRESHWHYQGLLVNNPNLQPELAKNKEVGLNVLRDDVATSGDTLRFKASFFDNHYNDYIVRGLMPNQPPNGNRYYWDNIDSVLYQGFELSGGYDARTFFVEGAFTKYTKIEYCPTSDTCGPPAFGTTLSGSTNPTASDYVSNYVPPEYSGSLTVGARLFDEKMTVGGRAHFASVRAGTVWEGGNAARVGVEVSWPEYVIFDAFGSFKLSEDATLSWSIENITDEYYFGALSSVGIPSPGRTVRVAFTNTFGGDDIPKIPDLTLGRAAEGAPGSNWTGLYVGGYVGYTFAGIDGETTASDGTAGGIPATESASLNLKDMPRGGQIGVNYQLDNGLVLGVEGDFAWSTAYGQQVAISTEGTLGDGSWRQAETEYSFDWSASLRGRIGYAFDRLLVYGTGGLAFMKEEQTRTQYQSNSSASNPYGNYTQELFQENASATRQGWTAGGGFEYALSRHWSLKGEYQYSGFGAESFLFSNARSGVTRGYTEQVQDGCVPLPIPVCIPNYVDIPHPGTSDTTNGRKASNELELHTIKLGVNYRF